MVEHLTTAGHRTRWRALLQQLELLLLLVLVVLVSLWSYWSGNQEVLGLLVGALLTYIAAVSRLLLGDKDAWVNSTLRAVWRTTFERFWILVLLSAMTLAACVYMSYLTYQSYHFELVGFLTFNGAPVTEPVTVSIETAEEARTVSGALSRFVVRLDKSEAQSKKWITAVSEHYKTENAVEITGQTAHVPLCRRHNLTVQIRPSPNDDTVHDVPVILSEMTLDGTRATTKTDAGGKAYFEAARKSQFQIRVLAGATYVSKPFPTTAGQDVFLADLGEASLWLEIVHKPFTIAQAEASVPRFVKYSSAVLLALASAGNKPTITGEPLDAAMGAWLPRASRLLVRRGFIVSHNDEFREPQWVAYYLGGRADHFKRPPQFKSDSEVPVHARAEVADYVASGYDRGHLVALSDMAFKRSQEAVNEAHLLSAICPQTRALNQSVWAKLEEFGRASVERYRRVYVFAGPVFIDKAPSYVNVKIIGAKGVAVPPAFFRILAHINGGKLQVLAFIIPNEVALDAPIKGFLTSVDAIEQRTGLDFFSGLPDAEEGALEADVAGNLWQLE